MEKILKLRIVEQKWYIITRGSVNKPLPNIRQANRNCEIYSQDLSKNYDVNIKVVCLNYLKSTHPSLVDILYSIQWLADDPIKEKLSKNFCLDKLLKNEIRDDIDVVVYRNKPRRSQPHEFF